MNKLSFSWVWLKAILISTLKDKAFKIVLKKVLGSATAVGWQAWLIKYVVSNLYEEVAAPLIKAAFNQMGYIFDRQDGIIKVTKINEAREQNNETNYDDAIDDVFSRSKVPKEDSL